MWFLFKRLIEESSLVSTKKVLLAFLLSRCQFLGESVTVFEVIRLN